MMLGILTLNIANPSAARAERQLAWLSERPEHVLVLTETSPGAGTRLLFERLAAAGWEVRAGALDARERGVAIASRVRAAPRGGDIVDYLPSRAELVALERLDVVGLYVPSRNESAEKTERKRRFCAALSRFLAERPARDVVVIGDLNVLEPTHRPHYGIFRDWEYRLYDEFLVRGFVDAYRLRHLSANRSPTRCAAAITITPPVIATCPITRRSCSSSTGVTRSTSWISVEP
jgi:exodeoxyribonuclease-3